MHTYNKNTRSCGRSTVFDSATKPRTASCDQVPATHFERTAVSELIAGGLDEITKWPWEELAGAAGVERGNDDDDDEG
jgi:hypothetical protein